MSSEKTSSIYHSGHLVEAGRLRFPPSHQQECYPIDNGGSSAEIDIHRRRRRNKAFDVWRGGWLWAFRREDFASNELITMYDGQFLLRGRSAVCTLDVQTHACRMQGQHLLAMGTR